MSSVGEAKNLSLLRNSENSVTVYSAGEVTEQHICNGLNVIYYLVNSIFCKL